MSRILFDSVTKRYEGDVLAVDEFDLEIEDGEFLTLVGPSGSGKSTLLRMLAGLEEITDGEIRIGDTPVNRLPPRKRDIAMVFQNYALYPHLSVRDNMAFGLKRSTDLPAEEINERVREAAELMGIGELLDQKPKHLSGGQRQRVATGRAIVRDPAVFLFDEPLSNLDAKLRKHMRTELQRLQQTFETTTIYVTHDQEEAMTMSDRIAILNHGTLQQVGPPREVYNRPKNTFVAQFIGSPSMNMFVSELDLSGEQARFTGDIELPIPRRQAEAIAARSDADRFLLGVRPEHIHVHETPTEESVRAFVDIIEPLGSNDLLYFDLEDHVDVSSVVAGGIDIGADEQGDREEYKVFIEPDSIPQRYERSDDPVYLTFDTEHVHVFDPNTGENLSLSTASVAEAQTESATGASD
ncbi:ABC transporter ATP-binding protein [Halopelagius longus]|uniref:ABC-type D-xylose/L-arabinose transporter n=1 Tax=Halopelagius longus TaxID=1236180 RepID=A0A1H1FMC8_9EURY|nr:sn-glycerol-3-phosphate ABC transporter ATP-binding protein UgpC [Halopelagius longus]RDI70036.1 sn-glycerol-3-phosphate ABC transporter ATP-binding protein UgpC [Halopelagius longus]SDR01948.1 carbohydrate ABC transporter ATP-binding protein, CUT1 family [Halopelagius longus]